MNALSMLFAPPSCHFLFLRSTFSHLHRIFQTLKLVNAVSTSDFVKMLKMVCVIDSRYLSQIHFATHHRLPADKNRERRRTAAC
jgi:hypothetical protein